MKESLLLFLDACTFLHIAEDSAILKCKKKLTEDVQALQEIKKMFRASKIRLGISAMAYDEASSQDKFWKAEKLWSEVDLPIFPDEIGSQRHRTPSHDVCYENAVARWNSIAEAMAVTIKDKQGNDTKHATNAHFFKGIFITTDYKFLNKVRNEGKHFLANLRAMRPKEFCDSLIIKI